MLNIHSLCSVLHCQIHPALSALIWLDLQCGGVMEGSLLTDKLGTYFADQKCTECMALNNVEEWNSHRVLMLNEPMWYKLSDEPGMRGKDELHDNMSCIICCILCAYVTMLYLNAFGYICWVDDHRTDGWTNICTLQIVVYPLHAGLGIYSGGRFEFEWWWQIYYRITWEKVATGNLVDMIKMCVNWLVVCAFGPLTSWPTISKNI